MSALATLGLLAALSAFSAAPGSGTAAAPSAAFWAALEALCGQAFAGRIVANEPPNPNDPFAGKPLVMHVRSCTPGEIRIPFHVGDDRSRTWVVTRTAAGLRLKHDHRHEDGSEDAVTQYGGDTVAAGTPTRQEFPADAESRELFTRRNMPASLPNVWALELEPGKTFTYELARPGRLFRVELDLTRPIPPPPAPWGFGSVEAEAGNGRE
jgi:hypothetical protein